MQSKFFYFTALFILLVVAQARPQSGDATCNFILQVGSFPDLASAEKFIVKLKDEGEQPAWGTVDLPGRGKWTRVFIGSFQTLEAARKHGNDLVKRGIIAEFLVRTSHDTESLSRPRKTTAASESARNNRPVASTTPPEAATQTVIERKSGPDKAPLARPSAQYLMAAGNGKTASRERTLVMNGFLPSVPPVSLPPSAEIDFKLAPAINRGVIPRPDPVKLALKLIVGELRPIASTRKHPGGLWVAGDLTEAASRLRWIVGDMGAALLTIDEGGQVELDQKKLAQAAGVDEESSIVDPLKVVDYIYSNEGLLLLVQLTQGQYRYCLHISRQAPTLGQEVEVNGSVNLDNNYDSRINPYRRLGKKLDNERPPEGFDSIVAINPVARWFNLRQNNLVPVGHITFHELAEAHAKLVLELDYLGQGARPGAHNVALDRERRLKQQRPFSDVVITVGSNRVLRSEEEIRQFYLQSGINVSSPR